jgi:YHS domain-containing protein
MARLAHLRSENVPSGIVCPWNEVFRTNAKCATEEPQSTIGPPYSFTNQGEIAMTSTTVVKDPVCGMDIESATAAGHTDHDGRTYYFCGSKCKEKFDHNPVAYLGKSAEKPKSDQGCCG